MLAPVAPYALRGFLWYQGENEADQGRAYRTWLPRLINDWRQRWGQPEAPFLVVQLPGYGTDSTLVAERGWPFLREAQAMALDMPQVGLAVTIDVGDPKDLHPAGKAPIGQRLALLARNLAYRERDLVASGPRYASCEPEPGGVLRLHFTNTGSGLVAGSSPWYAPSVEAYPTDRLIGFAIAGADRVWREAVAVIDGSCVLVSHPQIPQPLAVRYAWRASPRANLYHREGLPAAPFRTDSD